MGSGVPHSESWNLMQDGPAAQRIVNDWPTPIVFTHDKIGLAINTGSRLYSETPEDNPVRLAYQLWTGGTSRHSWDQTAVLYAARGCRDYWSLAPGKACHVAETGANEWRDAEDSNHAYLVPVMPIDDITREIEDLMVRPPRDR